MKGNVCILCLRRFEVESGGWSENDSVYQSRITVPYNSFDLMPPPEDSHQTQEGRFDLYSKFLLFTGRFLKVPLSEIFLQLAKERQTSTPKKTLETFCENCQALVSQACDVYAELEAIKLQLLMKVGELEKVTRLSTQKVSVKLSRGLIKSAAEQLKIKINQLVLYRKSLVLNCKRKTIGGNPKILVTRGLFPEYLKFTYSATLKVLMRLIVVFAFASSDLTTTTPVKEPEKVLKTHEPQHNRRPRTKRKFAEPVIKNYSKQPTIVQLKFGKDVKQEGNDEAGNEWDTNSSFNDAAGDDHVLGDLCTGVKENYYDSDWSGGAVSPAGSHDSAGSDVNVSSGQLDEVPEKRQRLRRRCQRNSSKQEPDRDEGNEKHDTDDEEFKSESGNRRHTRCNPKIHSDSGLKNEATISCKLCKKKFISRSGLIKHLLIVHNTRFEYTCKVCGLKCKSNAEFNRHNRIVHGKNTQDEILPCQKCGQKFVHTRGLLAHMRQAHHSHGEYTCNICGDKFRTTALCYKHKVQVHNRLKLQCLICPKITTGELRFHRHLQQHENDTARLRVFHCEICRKTFCSEVGLAEHIILEHEKEIKCSTCDAKFGNYRNLRDHLKTHETGQKNYWCHFCFQGYTNEQYMQVHQKIIHVGLNKLVCDQERCTEEFVSVEDLNEHLKVHIEEMRSNQLDASKKESKHEDDNKNKSDVGSSMEPNDEFPVFTCEICSWSFLNKYSLTLHELVHIPTTIPGEKGMGFRCPQPNCGKTSERKFVLITHYNLYHGAKSPPYNCHECKAKFTHLVMFKIHLRCHEERKSGKKFICDICNEECLDTLNFNWHRRSHDLDGDVIKGHDPKKPKRKTGRTRPKHLTQDEEPEEFSTPNRKRRSGRPRRVALTKEDQEMQDKMTKDKERRKVNCELCQKTCESTNNLLKHLEKEHDDKCTEEEKVIQCNFCSLKFVHQQTHQLHMKHKHSHSQEKKFICDAERCIEVFENHLALNEHLKNTHLRSEGPTDENFTIMDSSSAEGSASSAKKIVLKVMSISYCKICNWGFVNPDFLQLHEICHIPFSGQTYNCPICEEKFASNRQRNSHFNVEHGKNLKTFKCLECPSKTFSSSRELTKHKDYHKHKSKQSENMLICDDCGRIFRDSWQYNFHKKTHDSKNLILACSEVGCDKRFVNEKLLDRHLKMEHGHGERYPCPVCGLSFPYECMTKKHTDEVHGPRKFECDICHKKFKRVQYLEEHKQLHDDTPSYICTECGKSYKVRVGLDWHMASVHTPDHLKRFGCPHCPYRTHRKMLFNSHLKTCTRNKGIPHVEAKGTVPNKRNSQTRKRRKPRKKREEDTEEMKMEEETTTEEEDEKKKTGSLNVLPREPILPATTSTLPSTLVDPSFIQQQQCPQHFPAPYLQPFGS